MKPDPDLEKLLIEYENLEKQLQMVILQKHQLQLQLNEISLASEELKKAKGDVYKSIGSVMVRSNKDEASADLEERTGLITVKLGTLEKQEQKLRELVANMQKKLQERMKGQ